MFKSEQQPQTKVHNMNVPVPINVGTSVTLKEYVTLQDDTKASRTYFEGTVERLVPETALIQFKENETGMYEFKKLCEQADIITVTAQK